MDDPLEEKRHKICQFDRHEQADGIWKVNRSEVKRALTEDGLSTNCDGFDDVGATTNTGVEEDGEFA